MMKANIFEIKRFAVHDGDGIRTTVFFKGCSLRCVWCHNPEGLISKPQLAYYKHKCIGCGECVTVCPMKAHSIVNGMHMFDRAACVGCGKCADVCLGDALILYGREMNLDELLNAVLEDREFYENSGGGVTLSGGECLLQADFCAALLKKLKEQGINTAVDTCGFVPRQNLDKIIPYTDKFLYDIKAIDDEVHTKCTGFSNESIIDNLRYLDQKGCNIEIRIPFVPEYNDGEMQRIKALLAEFDNITKIRVLPYHSYAVSKYEALGMESTLPDKMPMQEDINQAEYVFSTITKSRKKISDIIEITE